MTNKGDRWFFVLGFEKTERSNITTKEEAALKVLASDLLSHASDALDKMVGARILMEICREGQEHEKGEVGAG